MRPSTKTLALFLALALMALGFSGCASHTFVQTEPSVIVSVQDLPSYIGKEGVVIVDTRSPEDYAAGHVEGAVNIPTDEIVINVPVKNMLTSQKKIEKLMGANGISNNTTVIAYDSNRMGASRLLWTLFMYGHRNVKVVDGGFDAISAQGLASSTDVPTPAETVFEAREPSSNWLATQEDVLSQVNAPDGNVILLDVRTMEEYYEAGKVPTSTMIDWSTNFFSDQTFKTTDITKINYMEAGIFPENEIIIYCQTSFRAAPVFVQLFEAGYRNIRIYDGAYLEWTSNSSNPIEMPAGAAAPAAKDAS
ncbi:MAG: sulfurtransferase [Subdoligranulum sp.]|nr:sulfurtransferase [Subdoligranulum sp.]